MIERQRLFKGASSVLGKRRRDTEAQPKDQELRRDLNLLEECPDFDSITWKNAVDQSLIEHENIKSIHNSKKKCITGLIALIKYIQITERGASVILKDTSGEINGAIHQAVVGNSTLITHLCQGSVLELQNISVFRPSQSVCCLNVTLKSIKSIFINGNRIINRQNPSMSLNIFKHFRTIRNSLYRS